MTNLTATGALFAWPLVALVIFLALPVRRAVIWSIVLAYLLLPPHFSVDIQGLPELDKTTLPNFAIFLLAMAMVKPGDFVWPRSGTLNTLMALYVFSPIITGFLNGDPVHLGLRVLPAMTFYDSISAVATHIIEIMPFVLAAGLMRSEESHRDILKILVVATLVYCLPILEEIRMSPQLTQMLYSINNGKFAQAIRFGGYRASVFVGHGLLIGMLLTLSLFASAGLWRNRQSIWGIPMPIVSFFLAIVLVLNKSLGSVALAIIFVPIYLLAPTRRFLSVAAIIAAIIVCYPALRSAGVVPVDKVEQVASQISNDRAQSFAFRIKNENDLLERANERPVAGWGAWARNRVFAAVGNNFIDTSVTDGLWVLTIGTFGWLGYVGLFGLLTYPIFRTYRMRKLDISYSSSALVGMLMLSLIDLVPNASLKPITWLIAGALSQLALVPAAQAAQAAIRRMSPYERHVQAMAS